MSKKREFVKLNELLTEKERALSDFEGSDFKKQTLAVVELLTKKEPRRGKIEAFLAESDITSSSDIWNESTTVKDLTTEQCFAKKMINDSSLTSSRFNYVASWAEFDTTIDARTFHGLQDECNSDQATHTNLHFNMHTTGGKNYEGSLERAIPTIKKNGEKFITVTILIPATHKQVEKVSDSVPEWTFYHVNTNSNQSLALRLFTALECLGMSADSIGGDDSGVWSKLVSRLNLPVSSMHSSTGKKNYTLFQQEEKLLYPLFKGIESTNEGFSSKSHAPKDPSAEPTKHPRTRHQLITGLNELMMFTSGTAISLRVPAENIPTLYQRPTIIAPNKWTEALGNSSKANLQKHKNLFHDEKILPVHSYLFNEDYAYDDVWRRFHKERKYFSPDHEKYNGRLGKA